MTKGKICSQACHATARITRKLEKNPNNYYKMWINSGEAKIILKTDQSYLETLISKYPNSCCYIIDAGLTQVEPNSLTALVFVPSLPDDFKEIVGHLKLL